MKYGPPANPTEGQEWKSGRDRYRFQTGKGWVDASLYREPVRETVTPRARRSPRAAAVKSVQEFKPLPVKPKAKKPPRLCGCGAELGRYARSCKACAVAARRAAKPPKDENHCACGAVIGASSRECRTCYRVRLRAEAAAKRPPPPPAAPKLRVDPEEAERNRLAVQRLEQAQRAREEARIAEERRALERAAAPAPPRRRPSETVEVKVPASVPRPVDPLAKKDRPKPVTADPLDSDAFRAQLERVKAGAGLVTVQPVTRRTGPGAPTGSSLTNF